MAKVSDVIDVPQSDEPVTNLPSHAGGASQDKYALREAALEEGVEAAGGAEPATIDDDAAIETLAEQEEEPSVAQLRELAGKDAEGMSDDELVAEYEKAKGEEAFKLPFPIYDAEGNKVTDVNKLTLEDVLSGKVQIGYNAMGKEQRKAIQDILRVAANGHLNESKIATTLAERNQVHAQLQDLKKQHEAWAADRQTWDKVLNAAVRGNVEPLQRLIQAYMTDDPTIGQQPRAQVDDASAEAAGQQYILNTIIPQAYKIAAEYGADGTEVTQEILRLIQQEPAEFLSQAKIEAILQHEIHVALETAGYTRNGTPPQAQAPNGNEELLKRLDTMQKELLELKAGKENAATQQVRRKAPAAGGGSVSSAGDSMPVLKSREDMKRYLRGEM